MARHDQSDARGVLSRRQRVCSVRATAREAVAPDSAVVGELSRGEQLTVLEAATSGGEVSACSVLVF
jgi:hypothetical protein